jgi:hypothetical protein
LLVRIAERERINLFMPWRLGFDYSRIQNPSVANDSMVNYDCCDNLKELYRMGYIDNHQVFLQRTSVYTELPVSYKGPKVLYVMWKEIINSSR